MAFMYAFRFGAGGAVRRGGMLALLLSAALFGGCGGGDDEPEGGDEPVTVWAPLGMGLIRLPGGQYAGRLWGTSAWIDAALSQAELEASGLHPSQRRCSTDTLMRGGQAVTLAKGVPPVYVLFDVPRRELAEFELYGFVTYTEGDEVLGRPFWPCENEGPGATSTVNPR